MKPIQGPMLSEGEGATLFCDRCHKPVRSTDAHTCNPAAGQKRKDVLKKVCLSALTLLRDGKATKDEAADMADQMEIALRCLCPGCGGARLLILTESPLNGNRDEFPVAALDPARHQPAPGDQVSCYDCQGQYPYFDTILS